MRRLAFAILLAAAPMEAAAQPELTPAPAQYDTQQPYRPSGFWTSTRPAVGGAYRWRMLGIGIVFALGGGLLIRRVIRRANAERAAAK